MFLQYFESNIFNMIVDICFSRRETCTQHWKISGRAGDKQQCLNEMRSHIRNTGACCGFRTPWPTSGSCDASFIWLVLEMCFDQKPYKSFAIRIWALSRLLIHSLPGLSLLTLQQDYTCKHQQVSNSSRGRNCILRDLGVLCWAAFSAVPSHLCVSLISSSNRTKCARGFNKRVQVTYMGGMWVKDTFFLTFLSA